MSVPLRAGDSPLQSKFVDGGLLMLRSIISGRNLRIASEGELDARGKDGREAHFRVHVHRPGTVSLQSLQNPEWWVAIYEGHSTGTGRGPYCEFQVEEIGNNVVLISEACAGQWIGVLRDGGMKSPMETTLGVDAQFAPIAVDPTSSESQPTHHLPRPVPKPRARPRPQSKPAPPQSLDSPCKPIWIAPPPPIPPPPTTAQPVIPPPPPRTSTPVVPPPLPTTAPPTTAPPATAPPVPPPPRTAPPATAPPTTSAVVPPPPPTPVLHPPIPPPTTAPPTTAPPTTAPPTTSAVVPPPPPRTAPPPPVPPPPRMAPPTIAPAPPPPRMAPPTTTPPTTSAVVPPPPPRTAPPATAPPVPPPTTAPPTTSAVVPPPPPTTAPSRTIPPPIPPRRQANQLTLPGAQQVGREELPDHESSLQSQTHNNVDSMRHPSSSMAAVTETVAFSVAAVAASNQTRPQVVEPWPEAAAQRSHDQRQTEVELQVEDHATTQVHSHTPEDLHLHDQDHGQEQIVAENPHDDSVQQQDVTDSHSPRQEVRTDMYNRTQEAEHPRVDEGARAQNLELAVARIPPTGTPELTRAESIAPEPTQASSHNNQTPEQVEVQHLQESPNQTPEQSRSQNSEHSQNNQTPGRSLSLTSEELQSETLEYSQEPPEYSLFSPDYSQTQQMETQVHQIGAQQQPGLQRPMSEYPQQQQHYFQQHPSAPMHPSYPAARYSHFDSPFIPYHFTMMDAFREGNQVWLVSGTNGCPLQVVNCKLCGNGNYAQANGQFIVVVPGGTSGGVVMLQNAHWRGCYISIRGNRLVANGKGDNWSLLRVHILPDNHVCFESAMSPGQFIGISSFGDILPPNTLSTLDYDAQFRIRIARQRHQYSNDIVTTRGTPSIFKILRDRMIVQIYLKGQGIYLSLGSNGKIKYTEAADNESTFFVLHDRGLGVVSLFSYKNTPNVLKIVKNGLTGRGIPDLNSDFYLRENMDGTVSLESCTCSNALVSIKFGGQLYAALSLKVVTIRKVGKRREVTITAI